MLTKPQNPNDDESQIKDYMGFLNENNPSLKTLIAWDVYNEENLMNFKNGVEMHQELSMCFNKMFETAATVKTFCISRDTKYIKTAIYNYLQAQQYANNCNDIQLKTIKENFERDLKVYQQKILTLESNKNALKQEVEVKKEKSCVDKLQVELDKFQAFQKENAKLNADFESQKKKYKETLEQLNQDISDFKDQIFQKERQINKLNAQLAVQNNQSSQVLNQHDKDLEAQFQLLKDEQRVYKDSKSNLRNWLNSGDIVNKKVTNALEKVLSLWNDQEINRDYSKLQLYCQMIR